MSDLSREARAFLDGVRDADDPSPVDRREVRRALLAVTAGATAAVATPAAAATVAAIGKFAIVPFIGGLAVGLVTVGVPVLVWSSKEAPPREAPAATASVAALPVPEPRATAAASPVIEPLPAPHPSAVRASPVVKGTTTDPSSAIAENPHGTLDQELLLVRRAQVALQGGDATLALSILEEHASRFPSGALAEERDAAIVVALCTLKRTDAAARARRFLALHPSSPSAPRIRALCNP